jgi:hypothetical protein
MIYILALSCFNILFIAAEPIILLKRYIGFREEEFDTYKPLKRFLHKMIYCCLCSGFWISLIISHNIFMAAIASVLGEYIYKKIIE